MYDKCECCKMSEHCTISNLSCLMIKDTIKDIDKKVFDSLVLDLKYMLSKFKHNKDGG